ncbi:DnaJ-like protein [Pseudacidovorax intermedius]|uniref:DnaJ-like protein n=1 Tax=Pseudacidovorax intermedius TaxID=433924 RepID=A0A370FG58_9BURK|nr:DnaJ domain-containing protein [Pseudacidovorax intermedius]RDI25200.1 DnaJ-like protein [Pseudacidovorax intermedius]
MTVKAFPLQWPVGWKRTDAAARAVGRFVSRGGHSGKLLTTESISIHAATVRLKDELGKMAVADDDLVLSTNLTLRLDGMPRSGQAEPSDPGAAVYWLDPWTNAPRCMAIDRYTKVAQNIAALAATIEAMRAIERHGGALVLERAFTGFTALPAPGSAGTWWEVLEVTPDATAEQVQAAHRRLAAAHHPDRGGDAKRMAEVNRARDEGLQQLGGRR